MMTRNLLVLLFFFAKFHSYQGCTINKNKVSLPSKEYDLSNPYRIKLPEQLSEISGLSYYPKDSSVFAISDESGNLYKIFLNKKVVTLKWKFDKIQDFEDIIQHGNFFYVLESNGNIQSLTFSANGDTIFKRKTIFPEGVTNKDEFESLYYDDKTKGLVMICKDCEGDKKKSVSAWNFDPETEKYTPANYTINADFAAKKLGDDKIKFKPSAAAVNPLTKDIWVLSAINQLIVVTDETGATKEVYTLNPSIFKQPEGITFTPWGDLLISNEATDKYETSTLLIFKPQKRG